MISSKILTTFFILAVVDANVQTRIVIPSPADLGTIDGKQITPLTWLGQIFDNGPNVTITGPSLTRIVEKIVEINPNFKFLDGTPAVNATNRAIGLSSLDDPPDNRFCGVTSSPDNPNYPCVSKLYIKSLTTVIR
jgi:hypothetical protein